MIKLVVTDIDDTLLNSKGEISLATHDIVKRCIDNDIKVILASGRPDFGMKKIVDILNLASYDNYLLSYNGAKISNIKTGKTIYEKFLSVDRIKFLIDKSIEYGCDILTYQEDKVITNSNNNYAVWEANALGVELVVDKDMKNLIKDNAAKVIMLKNPEEALELKDMVKSDLGDSYEVAMSKPFFIEVNDKGISKGVALNSLCQKIGKRSQDFVALGDGLNDLSMIEFAGTGIAMGNAVRELKDKANFVTKTNDEEGFSYALKKFVFNEK